MLLVHFQLRLQKEAFHQISPHHVLCGVADNFSITKMGMLHSHLLYVIKEATGLFILVEDKKK
jgi:hypothetical protein